MTRRCLHCVIMDTIQKETSDKEGSVDLSEVVEALGTAYADTLVQGDNEERMALQMIFAIAMASRVSEHKSGNLVVMDHGDTIGPTKGTS